MLSISNPVFFIIDCMKAVVDQLSKYEILNINLWTWFIGFIFVGMVVSVFWRGARG